jgi:hypothetical protein
MKHPVDEGLKLNRISPNAARSGVVLAFGKLDYQGE